MISSSSARMENVDHLLKHLAARPRRKKPAATPRRARSRSVAAAAVAWEQRHRSPAAAVAKTPAVTVTHQSSQENRSPRYSLRVVLCAYMIMAHPSAVLSGQRGEGETQLVESVARFVEELLTKTLLDDGPSGRSSAETTFREDTLGSRRRGSGGVFLDERRGRGTGR